VSPPRTGKPTPLSGFPELLPRQRAVELSVLDSLRRTFELHGFASVETRAVEPLDQLLRKGDTSKEVYLLRRLQAEAEDTSSAAGLGLHFDLTVPFARYVLENAGKLDFPLRRYQIQRCWRGERPQEGRYREFTQADIDIIGSDELPLHADAEVAAVMAEALSRLPVPPLRLQINNRVLIDGFYRGLGVEPEHTAAVMQAVDKLDKLSPDAVARLLVDDVGVSARHAEQALALARISGDDATVADQVLALGVQHPLLDEGIAQLVAVLDAASTVRSDTFSLVADLSIARGLDYYTGTVFETRMQGYEHLGSICSGGRYDRLASDDRHTYPGVGISLGVSRLLVPLLADGVVDATRSVPSAVLIAVAADESRSVSTSVAQSLRARGIAAEVAPSAARFGKQIRFAERRGIPYVWFPSDQSPHQVKDIRSGVQVDADPDDWTPPLDDLHPRVVAASAPLETLS
jgi:histidyl-tRNA synthetase